MKYKVVAVLWQDHLVMHREQMPSNPDETLLQPTITFGILAKETDKTIMLVSDIERYPTRDEATYTVILKSTVEAMQTYGEIELDLRYAP